MRNSVQRFFEILEMNGISTRLDDMTVAMHIGLSSGEETVTFQGVGNPIPSEVLRAINEEVIPLLELERNGIYQYEIVVSDEILALGEPVRRQARWAACMSNLDG